MSGSESNSNRQNGREPSRVQPRDMTRVQYSLVAMAIQEHFRFPQFVRLSLAVSLMRCAHDDFAKLTLPRRTLLTAVVRRHYSFQKKDVGAPLFGFTFSILSWVLFCVL